jgi:iron complex transport system substrate-binding protein
MRILSLLPSATEIVYALGLGDDLVGVSHECDYPEEARTKPIVSTSTPPNALRSEQIHSAFSEHGHSSHSLYRIDEQLLKQIDPDVILTQELCTVCAIPVGQVREAARILAGPRRVLSLEPSNLRQILENISAVAEVTGRQAEAAALVSRLKSRIARISSATTSLRQRPRVFCMEWMEPVMAGGHWVPEMIRLAGGTDGLGNDGQPSIAIEWEQVVEFAPQILIIMPCGYKISQSIGEIDRLASKHGFYDLPAVQCGEVYAVDSPAFFSRPGPRVVNGLEILAQIIHPELFSGLFSTGATMKLAWDSTEPIESQRLSERFIPL